MRIPIISRFLERRYSLSDLDRDMDLAIAGRSTATGTKITEKTALESVAVFACVSLLSETLASVPLPLYRRLTPRSKRRAYEHPLYSLLHDAPNPEMTSFNFREAQMAHLVLWGNAYAEIDWNMNTGRPRAFWPLLPNKMRVKREKGGLYYYYRLPDGQEEIFPSINILHVPGPGFDGLIGYSPIHMVREAIGLSLATEEFGARFFGNGAKPGGVLEHPGKLGETAQENLRKSWNEMHQGLSNQHRIAILEEGMKYQQIGIPPDDAQFLECISPDTMISMADGSRKPAYALIPDDAVMGWNENHPIIAKVATIGKPPIKSLIKIITARGRELTATYDHPCLALRSLRTAGGRKTNRNPEWIKMGDLKIGNYVRVSLGHVVANNSFNFEDAWLLGVLVGDGYVRKLGCSFSTASESIATYMDNILTTMGGGLQKRSGDNYDYEIKTGGSGCKGSPIRTFLNNSGLVGLHSHDKRVPACILHGGVEAWRGFLSGYFDTDGSIRELKGKQKSAAYWSSINRELLEDCQHVLTLLGIQSAIYPMDKGGVKVVKGRKSNTKPSWGLYVMGSSQLKKLSDALSLAHEEKSKRLNEYSFAQSSKYTDENFSYDRIKSIENLGMGETIGIEIETCHTHITSGLITHNTRKFQRSEIASFFHIPPHMIGDLEHATFSNIEHQGIEFVVYTMRPWFVRWEQVISKKLLWPDERKDYFAEFLVEGLLRGDVESRYKAYSVGRQWGWLSANDVRELENMEPLPEDQGNIYYVPMNMLPAGTAQETKSLPITDYRTERGSQAAIHRHNTAQSYKRVFEDAVQRVVKRETDNILRAAKKYLGERASADFNIWLEDFYRDFPEFISKQVEPAIYALAEAIQSIAADEVNAEAAMTPELESFLKQYASVFNGRYTKSSKGQLQALIEEATEKKEEPIEAITTRLNEWEETRAGKTAMNEVTQLSNVVAKVVFGGAGIVRLRWVALGSKSCPLCQELNGKVVGIDKPFLAEGDILESEQGSQIQLYRPTTHPPLHLGCVCQIVPE